MKKKAIITFVFAAITMGVWAQNTDDRQESDTKKVESLSAPVDSVPAQYPGGTEALLKFLSKNIQYPTIAENYGGEGRVIMNIIVDADGTIKDISATNCEIVRFNSTKFAQETQAKQKELKELFAKQFAKEGFRVIRKMPKWIPGTINGKNIRTKYSIPITFRCPD